LGGRGCSPILMSSAGLMGQVTVPRPGTEPKILDPFLALTVMERVFFKAAPMVLFWICDHLIAGQKPQRFLSAAQYTMRGDLTLILSCTLTQCLPSPLLGPMIFPFLPNPVRTSTAPFSLSFKILFSTADINQFLGNHQITSKRTNNLIQHVLLVTER